MDKSEFLFKGQGKLASWPLSGMQQTVFHLTGKKDKEWVWKNKEMEEGMNERWNEQLEIIVVFLVDAYWSTLEAFA